MINRTANRFPSRRIFIAAGDKSFHKFIPLSAEKIFHSGVHSSHILDTAIQRTQSTGLQFVYFIKKGRCYV